MREVTPHSQNAYRRVLRDAVENGYHFNSFVHPPPRGAERVLYLRHDVDFSLAMAVELARINAEVGAMGTFFVLLRGHAYNPASRRSQERLAELLSLGQRVALHWAVSPELSLDHAALSENVRTDFGIADMIIPELDPAFAVHSASPQLLSRCLGLDASPLVNVNGHDYCRRMPYYSDSNLRYSVETWRAIIRRGEPRVHVLFHPVNWIGEGSHMLEVLRNAWPYLLSEAETELQLNRVWSAAFSEGLPDRAQREFARALIEETAVR